MKKISLFTATGIVIANMVGTGVFTSLGFQVGDLPSAFTIMLLWLIGGACAFCGAVSYAELASALPRSGGEYHFLTQVYHPAIGFLSGWLSATVGFAAPIAIAAMGFAKYASSFTPGVSPQILAIGIVTVATAVHLRSVIFGSKFQNVTTIFKLVLIVVFVGAGVFASAHVEAISFAPKASDVALITSAPFAVSLIYVMYSYSGWNASTYIVSEVRDPSRNVPLSVALGTGMVVVLYLALNAVFLHVAPMDALKGQIDVGHVAARYIFGPNGGQIMAGLICIGLISSISAMTWIGPRVTMSMGEDWRSLGFLAWKNKQGVPSMAIGVQYLIVVLLICTTTFDKVLTYVQFGLTLSSFLTVLGVLVLRRMQPNLPRPYRTWGYPLTPIFFLLVNGWMLVHVLKNNPTESLWGLGTLLAGLIFYFMSPNRPREVAA